MTRCGWLLALVLVGCDSGQKEPFAETAAQSGDPSAMQSGAPSSIPPSMTPAAPPAVPQASAGASGGSSAAAPMPAPCVEPMMMGKPDAAVDAGLACDCDETPDAGYVAGEVRQPEYNADGTLKRPADAEQWVFMGSGVNLNYVPLKPGIVVDVLTVTLMEPTAYRHFQKTGTFAEGTMTALMAFMLDSGAPPAEHGQYPGERLAFEMSVKDSNAHGADVWGYYGFGADGQAAAAHPASECNACHKQNAQTDFVFTQFYPFMRK